MAIPSGSGTEVLNRTTIKSQSTSQTAFRWDGTNATLATNSYTVPANHIITVLSIVFTEQGGGTKTFELDAYDGSNSIALLQSQTISGFGTFVWNDKIVLRPSDKLLFTASGSGIDAYCTFIDQDWS